MAAAEAVRSFSHEGLASPDGDRGVGVSREVAADCLRRCEATQLEAFEQALALTAEAADAALRAQQGWVDRMRAGLVAVLEIFDEEPALARYLVVGSAQAGPAVLARRLEVLERVAALLDDEHAPARAYPPPLTAHAVASGLLGVLHARLSQPQPGVLAELAGSLMSFTVLPFLGARAARRELERPAESLACSPVQSVGVVQDPGRRLSHRREIEALGILAGEPGLSNAQVALRAGIADPAQISRLLARLARLGAIESAPALNGTPGIKAWRLTASGERLRAEIVREASTVPGAVVGLSKEFAGLDFWSVCVLRAVGEQPWLTSGEVAARAGVEDPAQIARLLAQLAGMGLIDAAREAHRKGSPKVWQITDRGRELDRAIGRKLPVPARNGALDLMWQSGGRLSELAIATLYVIAAQPKLSNGAIAQRVEIADANSMSQLLARLLRRGLIENVRGGGRENAWVLTASGQKLQNAIHDEAPAARRTVAIDVLAEAGGRLNHRVVSVLDAIDAEPGLSNLEVAQRLGVQSKAHTSKLLARLARFGLIENQIVDPAPFQANAWRLTASGRQLQRTIRDKPQPATAIRSRNECVTSSAVGT